MPTPTLKNNPSETHLATRLLALVVILIGVGMVVWVFFSAKQLLDVQSVPLPTPSPKPLPGAAPAPDSAVGEQALRGVVVPLADLIRRLLILLVMCVSGSLIAALGIRLWGKR